HDAVPICCLHPGKQLLSIRPALTVPPVSQPAVPTRGMQDVEPAAGSSAGRRRPRSYPPRLVRVVPGEPGGGGLTQEKHGEGLQDVHVRRCPALHISVTAAPDRMRLRMPTAVNPPVPRIPQ